MGIILLFVVFIVVFAVISHLGSQDSLNIYDTVSLEAISLNKKSFTEPKNETEFREIFEKLAGELYGYRISVSQSKCHDVILLDKSTGNTLRAEIEYRASDFFKHKHKWDTVDMIICWHNDIKKSEIHILECKDKITEYYNTAGAK